MIEALQRKDAFEETKKLLEQWAAWVRAEHIVSGTTHVLAAHYPKQRSSQIVHITDDDALRVDAAVARLIANDEETGKVTKSYFLNNCSSISVARQMGIGRNRVSNIVCSGVAWIDAFLLDF